MAKIGILDGKKLEAWRLQRGLSVAEVRDHLSYGSRKSVYRIIDGETKINDLGLIKGLAEFLHCGPIDLIQDELVDLLTTSEKPISIPMMGYIGSDNHSLPDVISREFSKKSLDMNSYFPEDSYAVEIRGAACLPELAHGDIVIASPSLPWNEQGKDSYLSLCVVKSTSKLDMAWVRKVSLTRDGEFLSLTAINTSFAPIQLKYKGKQNEVESVHKIIHIIKSDNC